MRKDTGFTIFELVIAILVVSLIALPFVNEYRAYAENQNIFNSQNNTFIVEKAIKDFYSENGYLPCPGENYLEYSVDLTLGVLVPDNKTTTLSTEDPDFGLENCHDFEVELGNDPDTILIGSVPTQALGINAESAVDGWGNKLTYVVSKYMINLEAYDASFAGVSGFTPLAPTFIDPGDDPGGIEDPFQFNFRGSSNNQINRIPTSGFTQRFIPVTNITRASNQSPSEMITSTDEDLVSIINLTPEMLADFVNQQVSNAGLTAAQVSRLNADLATSPHYIVFSHGETGAGAFAASGGSQIACDTGSLDGENCDLDNLFYTNNEKFESSNAEGENFFDDIIYAFSVSDFNEFVLARDETGEPTGNIYSPYQIIGIGTDDPMGGANPLLVGTDPQVGIDIEGDMLIESDGTADKDGRALADNFCDERGFEAVDSNCFNPSIIGGPGVNCGGFNAINGLNNNNASCVEFIPLNLGTLQECGALEVMVGIQVVDDVPSIICEIPPI